MKSELEEVLNIAFNSKEIKDYYHFDKLKNRKLLIADYGFLKASIKVNELEAVFKSRLEIQDEFYIEFEDINLNPNRIDLELKINGEGVKIWFTFYKRNGEWKYREPSIFDNVTHAKRATKNAINLYYEIRLYLSLNYKTPNMVYKLSA